MAIAMQYVTGKTSVDPTVMIATLSKPILALSSLLLVAFANIGTQAVGSYIYGVMLKSSFEKIKYKHIIIILAIYVAILCVWGKIIDYFSAFLTITACIYAPLASILFVDFFFIKKQKISLRSAYNLPGYNAYKFTKGINIISIICIIVGSIKSLLVYNPISGEIHNKFLFYFTPTGLSFIVTGLLYYIIYKIPVFKNYILKDREEIKE